jgi:hypothetical protein
MQSKLMYVILLFVLPVAFISYFVNDTFAQTRAEVRTESQQNIGAYGEVCTMDAKLCPDGSYVGRIAPNCEFAPCPGNGPSIPPMDPIYPYPPNDGPRIPEIPRIPEGPSIPGYPPMDPDERRLPNDSPQGPRTQVNIFEESGISTQMAEGVERGPSANLESVKEFRAKGDVIRGWDDAKKVDVRARVHWADDLNSSNDFGLYIAYLAIENKGLKDIVVSEERAKLVFKNKVRLLGLIPMDVSTSVEVGSEGKVELRRPWYARFLAKVSEESELEAFAYTELAIELRARHEEAINLERNFR